MRPLIAAACLLAACSPPDPEVNPLARPPVDLARVGSLDEVAGWAYQKSVAADLDGNGTPENVVLASDVTLHEPTGDPLWEDGHRWAVFVEEGAERTFLYAAFVPHGFVESALASEESDGKRAIVIVERSPRHLRVMDIVYEGPGSARLRSDGHYPLEQWWPDSATLR